MQKSVLCLLMFLMTCVVSAQDNVSLLLDHHFVAGESPLPELHEDELKSDSLQGSQGEKLSKDTTLVENLMKEAHKHLGARYRLGSKGPNTFDCSGFTSYVFKQQGGMNIGGSSRDQYARNIPIKREELQPGDLVFFTSSNSGKNVGHVGLVTDYDPATKVFSFIHATRSAGITISKSNESIYARSYIGARRVQQLSL